MSEQSEVFVGGPDEEDSGGCSLGGQILEVFDVHRVKYAVVVELRPEEGYSHAFHGELIHYEVLVSGLFR